MEKIIAQVASKVVEEIVNYILEKGISEIGETAEGLLGILKEGALSLLSTAIQAVDDAIWNDKKGRKEEGLSVKARNIERVCVTGVGELRYGRTYYQYADGTKIFLVDHLIGIEPYERLTKELCAKLVESAASCSMAKAAEASGVSVSRQSVNNKILAMKDVVTDISRAEETPEELHIFADEDHAHLRPKRDAIVPLVTVTEGIDTTNDKRHKTINAVHFEGCGMRNEAFVENVTAAIYERYDVDRIRNIYIHADGANWIRKLGELLPNTVFIMDGFHAEKQFKILTRLKGAKSHAGPLKTALKDNNREAFMNCCETILQDQDEDGEKKLANLVSYFRNNWESIAERYSGQHCGSCTEPLVGHILSERLSRDPMAWTKEGLAKMAMLRIYVTNGNKVTAESIRISQNKRDRTHEFEVRKGGLAKYKEYADEQVRKFMSGNLDWSIFENSSTFPGLTDGKTTGTAMLLNALSHHSKVAS